MISEITLPTKLNTKLRIPIVLEQLQQTNGCGFYCYLLDCLYNTIDITYSLNQTKQTAIITRKQAATFSAIGKENNFDRRTMSKFAPREDRYIICSENGMGTLGSEVCATYNFYLVNTLNLNVSERETYARVWCYFYYMVGHFPDRRVSLSLDQAARDLNMRRATMQAALKRLMEDGWIVRYGFYKVDDQFGHGYSYTLPEDILENLDYRNGNY